MSGHSGSVLTLEYSEDTPLMSDRLSTIESGHGSVVSTSQLRTSLYHPSGIILVTSGLERFAFYGIVCNLTAFLGTNHRPVSLGLSSEAITLTALLFSQLPYLFAFAGGTLADTKWGRYHVYFAALVLQFLGSLLLLLSALLESGQIRANVRDEDRFIQFLVFFGLALLACGIACSSGTEIPLAIDQYRGDGGPALSMQFFTRYYFVINVASTVSYTVLSFVEMNFGFAIGFGPVCAAFMLAVAFLFHCRRQLLKVPATWKGSTLHIIFASAKQAWRARRVKRAPGETLSSGERTARQEDSFRPEDVRRLKGVVAVLLSLTVYMAADIQSRTEYIQQGQLMEAPLDRSQGLQIPPSMFASFNSVSILISIPLFHSFIFPRIRDSSFSYNITSLRRIGLGMFAALGSLLAAFLVEIFRRRATEFEIHEKLSGDSLTVSDMSIFYQIPQYMLSGVAEVLVFISALEFAYFKSPMSMRGFSMGFVYSVLGLGGLLSYLIGLIAVAVDKGLHYQRNTKTFGRMHYFYIIMMIAVVIGLVVFTLIARRFKVEAVRAAPSGRRKMYTQA